MARHPAELAKTAIISEIERKKSKFYTDCEGGVCTISSDNQHISTNYKTIPSPNFNP